MYFTSARTLPCFLIGAAWLPRIAAAGLGASPAWTAEGAEADTYLGRAVSSAGDVNGDGFDDVIVYSSGSGQTLAYHGSSAGLSAAPDWLVQVGSFSGSVRTAGDVDGDGYSDVIVGRPTFPGGPGSNGRALVYYGSAAGLGLTPGWIAEGTPDSYFGYSVAPAGDVNDDGFDDVLVAAMHYSNGQQREGAAYVFHGSASGLGATPDWTVESNVASHNFGSSADTAGDVNGDGYSDVIIGAQHYPGNSGWAYVYQGSPSGLSLTPDATLSSGGAMFGAAVATAGDVNGDGLADVIVGDYQGENAFLYYGSPAGLNTVPGWTGESAQNNTIYGASVASAGDVNADGFSDVLVGAAYYNNDYNDAGRAVLYYGSAAGLSAAEIWSAEASQHYAFFALSLGSAGDVNADGYSDVVIGAPSHHHLNLAYTGRAFVYHGGSDAPVIVAHPYALSVCAGGDVSFSVSVVDPFPNTYQWRRGSAPLENGPTGTGSTLAGATTATLRIVGVGSADSANDYNCRIANFSASATSSDAALTVWTTCVPADANCDGSVNFFDIDAFLLAVLDPAAFAAQYPTCETPNADVNRDGRIDFFDIDPFLACLFGSCP